MVWVLFFTFFVGIFGLLFFNHLPIAKQTELVLSRKIFRINQGGKQYSYDMNEIDEVIEYSTGRLPWSSIIKWKLKVDNIEFVVSSLTISKINFDRHFWNITKEKLSLFPML